MARVILTTPTAPFPLQVASEDVLTHTKYDVIYPIHLNWRQSLYHIYRERDATHDLEEE